MFDRMANGFELARQSLTVLRQHKSLMAFPVFSSIAMLLVLASFALPLWSTGVLERLANEQQAAEHNPLVYVLLFAFYFFNYLVVAFFNSALIGCVILRYRGKEPTIGDGIAIASARFPQIVGWALLGATVGVILRLIESRSDKVGQLVAALIGAGWSAATYFVVPVLVVEGVGPFEALKRSLGVIRQTWGEAMTANFGIGLATTFAMLIAISPALLGMYAGTPEAMAVGVGVTVVAVLIVSLVSATLNTIVLAALYLYAAEGRVPDEFDSRLFAQAFGPNR